MQEEISVPPAEYHTADHLDCPGCRAQSMVRAEVHLADMLFPRAFEVWIKARVPSDAAEPSIRYIADTSEETYREYAQALSYFFSRHRLRDIHDGHLRQYQIDRATGNGGWAGIGGQNRIHKEVGLMLRMLRNAGVWTEDLKSAFKPVPHVEVDVRRAMEPDEQDLFLRILRSRKDWLWIHDYATVALQTCASTNELRGIRFGDLDFRHNTLRVGPATSKTKGRTRMIPLETDEVLAALQNLQRRSRKFGGSDETHYLLPFGAGARRAKPDPARPISRFGLNGQWVDIRKQAGLPWLRPYDLRHTAITRMAEAGIPISTIMSFAGHLTPKMQQHYTTISMQAKRAAARAAWKATEVVVSGPMMPPKRPSMSVGVDGQARYGTH